MKQSSGVLFCCFRYLEEPQKIITTHAHSGCQLPADKLKFHLSLTCLSHVLKAVHMESITSMVI